MIPLADGCRRMKCSRETGLNLLLCGKLDGERDTTTGPRYGGRWLLTVESIERLLARRQQPPRSAAR